MNGWLWSLLAYAGLWIALNALVWLLNWRRVEIVDGSAEEAGENGDGEFCSNQPPKHRLGRLVTGNNLNNAVND